MDLLRLELSCKSLYQQKNWEHEEAHTDDDKHEHVPHLRAAALEDKGPVEAAVRPVVLDVLHLALL